MARVERPRNPNMGQAQIIARATSAAIVQGASVAAAAQETVDAAIGGDLIAASPVLAGKIDEIEERIDALETP
jgi:delta-aminolevulinic acid dehydratase/porphobilinogen synthase